MELNEKQLEYLGGQGYTERNPNKPNLFSKTTDDIDFYVDCRGNKIKVYAFDENGDAVETTLTKPTILLQLEALDENQTNLDKYEWR